MCDRPARSLPGRCRPALRATHVVADRTWGCLRVLEGTARLVMATEPPTDVELVAGGTHAIPPGVAHSVSPGDAAVITLEFLTR